MDRRQRGWETRLATLVERARTEPFQWGRWDCAVWACAAIQAVTGRDYAAPYRGRYHDAASARAVIGPTGFRVLIDHIATVANCHPTPPRYAHRGDVVLAHVHGHDTLGVCLGSVAAFVTAPAGLTTLPITDPAIRRAWSV